MLYKVMSKEKEYLTVKEAAEMLDVDPMTLRRWDKKGKLLAKRHPMNNYRLYRFSDINRLKDEISL